MSKVSEAKSAQNYLKEKDRPNCGNCNNFTCEKEPRRYGGSIERNLRCALGGFAVQKKSCCDMHNSGA